MYLMTVIHFRNGGGIGDASIRKMSYFDGSIDPKYKVRPSCCGYQCVWVRVVTTKP